MSQTFNNQRYQIGSGKNSSNGSSSKRSESAENLSSLLNPTKNEAVQKALNNIKSKRTTKSVSAGGRKKKVIEILSINDQG